MRLKVKIWVRYQIDEARKVAVVDHVTEPTSTTLFSSTGSPPTMDKLLRRVRMNERQVLRRLKKREKIADKGSERHDRRQLIKETGREAGASLKRAIVARHEDWELGPLAPRRDAPKVLSYNPTEQTHYGTLSINRALTQVKLRPEELEERCRWAGGPETLCLSEGDRVVITEGSHKGKIDKIVSISLEYGTVRLADVKVRLLPHVDTSGKVE